MDNSIEDGDERANRVASAVLERLTKKFLDFYGALEQQPDQTVSQHYDQDVKAGGRTAERALRKALAVPANRAAALGGAAGGAAFVPSFGTAASLSIVVGSTPSLFRYCIAAHDVIAHASRRQLTNPAQLRCARLLVLIATLPPKIQPRAALWGTGTVTDGVTKVAGWDADTCESLWGERETAIRQWIIGWTVPRSATALPWGIGALAGAWTNYAPVKSTVRAAENFYGTSKPAELGDKMTDSLESE